MPRSSKLHSTLTSFGHSSHQVPRFDVPAERELCIRADGIPPDGHRLCAGW
jgi:hypothetical protein